MIVEKLGRDKLVLGTRCMLDQSFSFGKIAG